jgi:cell division protein FtsB
MATYSKFSFRWNKETMMVPLVSVLSLAVLAFSFPATTILHQNSEIANATQQINAMRMAQQTLIAETKAVSTPEQMSLLAREQYQLVPQGDSLIQIVPTNQQGTELGNGDPGLQPIVNPLAAAVSGSTVLITTRTNGSSLWSRVVHTLEFWH